MNQISLLLLGLLCQNVAVISVMTLDLACTGETESLLGTGICLYFWHFLNTLNGYYYHCAVATYIPDVTHKL